MATNAPSPIGLRQTLRLIPILPPPRYYIKRPSRRIASNLLPKEGYNSTPFEALLYGNDAVFVAPKKKAVEHAATKNEEMKPEEKPEGKAANGNGKKNGNGKDEKGEKKGAGANDKGASQEKKDDGAKAAGGGEEAKDSGDFTKEQDEELMKLKNENASWAAISTAMNKPVSALKQRFGQVKPKDWRPSKQGKAGADAQPEGQKTEGDNSKKQEEEKKEDGKVTAKDNGKADGKAKGKANGANNGKKQASAGEDDVTSVYELGGQRYKRRTADGRFPPEVLQYAGKFDDRWYWLNMASRLFDKFGVRYTPEELKAKMLGLN